MSILMFLGFILLGVIVACAVFLAYVLWRWD